MKLPTPLQRSVPWAIFLVVWFVTLWILSSRPLPGPRLATELPIDKVLHFGYFFGGAGLLSATLFLQKKRPLHWSTIHLIVVVALTLVGSLDEWHQSWYQFRSGLDSADLTADLLGSLAGTLVFRKVQPKTFPQGGLSLPHLFSKSGPR